MEWHPGHKMVERSYDLLVYTMGLTTVVRWHFYIEIDPRRPFKFNDTSHQYSKFNYNDNLDSIPFYLNDEIPNKNKIVSILSCFYTPRSNEVERGVYWYHLVRLSVCPSVDRIVSALYLQQYSSDPFHICTSYGATSEGVSRVMPVSKLKNLKFWRIF